MFGPALPSAGPSIHEIVALCTAGSSWFAGPTLSECEERNLHLHVCRPKNLYIGLLRCCGGGERTIWLGGTAVLLIICLKNDADQAISQE